MINKVILIGNVGSDVTVMEVNNTKVANFSLATFLSNYTGLQAGGNASN